MSDHPTHEDHITMKKIFWLLIVPMMVLLYMCNKEEKDPVKEYLESVPLPDPERQYSEYELDSMKAAREEAVKRAQERNAAELRAKFGCGGVDLAVEAEAYIKTLLKRPHTAEFSGYQENMHGVDGDLLYYLGYVDSQNGFGAVDRIYFKVWMTCNQGTIVIKDVKLEENS